MRSGMVRPGLVGLLIRVVLGVASVYALVELITKWAIFRDQNLIESDFWFVTLFTLCLLPDVFNIGLRRRWGAWPIVVFLAVGAAIGSVGYFASGEIWTTALAAWVYVGDLVVFGALSVSFPRRSRREHRDASSTRCRGLSHDCAARRMRRRGAASWAWTCSTSNRYVVWPPFMNEVNEDERRPKIPTEDETRDLVPVPWVRCTQWARVACLQ